MFQAQRVARVSFSYQNKDVHLRNQRKFECKEKVGFRFFLDIKYCA